MTQSLSGMRMRDRRAPIVLLHTFAFLATLAIAARAQSLTGGSTTPMYAPDSVHQHMAMLYIGHISGTCYTDTVYGYANPLANDFLPRVIVWGQPAPTTNVKQSQRDSLIACRGTVPDSIRVAYTVIQYPAFTGLHGSATFRRFNSNDTLADIMIAMHGTATTGSMQRDSLRTLVVFGQAALTSQSVLRLTDVAAFQTTPFFAMDYRPGSQLLAPGSRDLTGSTSYELAPVSIAVSTPDTAKHRTLTDTPPVTMRIYPNPANNAATLEAIQVPSGEYLVEVVGVNGAVVLATTVTAHSPASILGTLDVSRLESGYYAVRVTDTGAPGGRLVGTYPVVVTR